jgi:Ca2+-binding RTX toxin-like protein
LNGSVSYAVLTVSLNGNSSEPISIDYSTRDLAATAGLDYTTTAGTLTFSPGVTSQTIVVPILNDNTIEADESFAVDLSNPRGANILTATATVNITDTLVASISTTLPALVENITLTGSAAISATGNDGNNTLIGNAGNNILTGGNGNDIYAFDADIFAGIDTVRETSTGGVDTLDFSATDAAITVSLATTAQQAIAGNNLRLVLSTIAVENVVGGNGNDLITGSTAANLLNGGNGNDTIYGGSGNDTIYGGSGNDFLYGQTGKDTLFGGSGSDSFVFNDTLSGTTKISTSADTIVDFTAGSDKILLSKATFAALTVAVGGNIGSNFAVVATDTLVATQSAVIVYSQSSSSLFYNQNGTASSFGNNGGMFATLTGVSSLSTTDFSII